MVRKEFPWQGTSPESFGYALPPETAGCMSPRERLQLLQREHQSLLKRQEQLLGETAECDYTDHDLLTVVRRLRSLALEIEKVRADGR